MNRLLLLICLIWCSAALSAQTADEALQQFEGHYIFHGTEPNCEAPALRPCYYYECDIQTLGEQLLLTGFVGNVDSKERPFYVGTYNPDNATIRFVCGGNEDGESVYDANNYRYFLYDFTLNVGSDAEGRLTLSRPGLFMFYAANLGNWPRASYSGLTFTKGATLPHWNGNILHPNTPATLDDLLTYTIEFENSHSIAAAPTDIMGLIYDADGQLYAFALVDGVIDAFGSMKIRESRATIHFVRVGDYAESAESTDSQKAAKAQIVKGAKVAPAAHTPGHATVIFKANSFIIDGQLIDYDIVQEYDL